MTVHHPVSTPTMQPGNRVIVRPARREDLPTVRRVVRDAYSDYASQMPRKMFKRYLADLLDLDRHARLGVLMVAEVDGRLCGSGAFYPDASVQGLGWPPGWAGGRALAVQRGARRHGVARSLIAECERLARTVGAPAFAFHTAPFMTTAISLYDGLGYRRAPQYDVDLGRIYDFAGSTEIRAIAYFKDLT